MILSDFVDKTSKERNLRNAPNGRMLQSECSKPWTYGKEGIRATGGWCPGKVIGTLSISSGGKATGDT
jgi:hypothetical protein